MKILVACEFSGVVRDAFMARGHKAVSCDMLPSESASGDDWSEEAHVQGDVREILADGWDLLIAHPPCTYLCNSGVRWLWTDGEPQYVEIAGRTQRMHGRVFDAKRQRAMRESCELFAALWKAPIARICIENPVMHRYARENLQAIGVPEYSQTIQPWQFGHGEIKRSCFWLRGLPELVPTNIVEGREARVHRASPGPDRWKERSRTLEGVAKAMSDQWG